MPSHSASYSPFQPPELTKELQHEESDSYYAPRHWLPAWLNSVVRQFMPPFASMTIPPIWKANAELNLPKQRVM